MTPVAGRGYGLTYHKVTQYPSPDLPNIALSLAASRTGIAGPSLRAVLHASAGVLVPADPGLPLAGERLRNDGVWSEVLAALVLAGIVAAPVGTAGLLVQARRRSRTSGTWPAVRRFSFALAGTLVLAAVVIGGAAAAR